MTTCRHSTAFTFAFALLLQVPAHADTQSDSERQKAHVVSRLFQVTYGAQQHCAASPEKSAAVTTAVDQFRATYPELLSLVDSSPYLPRFQENFKKFLADPARQASGEALVKECQSLEYMLRQLLDTPGGKQATDEYTQLLKK